MLPFSVVDLQGIQTGDLLMKHLNEKFKIFSSDNKTLLCNLSKIFVEILSKINLLLEGGASFF